MTAAVVESTPGTETAERPFRAWAWAGVTLPALAAALLLWNAGVGVLVVPFSLLTGGAHPSPAKLAMALQLASLPAGLLAGALLGGLQGLLLRRHLPGLLKGWVWTTALGFSLGMTLNVALSELPQPYRAVGPLLWGVSMGMAQSWRLGGVLRRAQGWLVVCVLGYGADGPITVLGASFRGQAAAAGRLDLSEGVFTWGPWLASLLCIAVLTAVGMKWLLAGPRVAPGPVSVGVVAPSP